MGNTGKTLQSASQLHSRAAASTRVSELTPLAVAGTPLADASCQHSALTRRDLTLLLGLLIVLLATHLSCERIPVTDGFGYDSAYGIWARSFPEYVFGNKVDDYYIRRILPSGLVYYSLCLLGAPLDNPHVILGFTVLNIFSITMTALVWFLVATELSLSLQTRWLGFIGLFGNYLVLKWSAYDPVMTDMPAYMIGMITVYCYLKRRPVALAVTTFIGAFIWPTVLPLGLLLLVFPRQRTALEAGPRRWPLPALLASLAAVAFLWYAQYLHDRRYEIPFGAAQPLESLWYPSLAIAVLYLLTGLLVLLRGGGALRPRVWWSHSSVQGAALAALVFAVTQFLYARFSSGPSGFNLLHRVDFTVFTAVAKPGVFYLAAVLFYGPLVLMALFAWRPMCRLIHREGPGVTGCALLGLLLSLCSEPRSLMNIVPLFVPFLAKAVDEQRWPPVTSVVYCGMSLLLSKFWLTINTGPFTGYTFQFPDQGFWLSYGPWISPTLYYLQAAIVAGFVLVLYGVRRIGGVPRSPG
jgi:hypothetical protein